VHRKSLILIVGPSLALDIFLFYYAYPRPAVIGFLGDFYNFVAAVWLAYDLLFKERESERKEVLTQIREDIKGRSFPLTVDGVTVEGNADLDRVFIRRTAGGALSACLLLGFGLTLVLLARGLEFTEQGKIEILWESLKKIAF
jgi:hypothetical protein